MLKLKDSKLYLIIGILGLAFLVSTIAFIAKSQAYKNDISTVAKLKEQNKDLQTKLNEFELTSLQLQSENKQLRSEMQDLIDINTLLGGGGKESAKFKEALSRKEEQYNKLKEEYTMLSESYNELLQEGLATSEQPEERRRREPTPEQMERMEQMRTAMRERTYEALDTRIREAKTDEEVLLLSRIRQAHNNLFTLQEQFRTTEDEERSELRELMGEGWRALGELYQDYNSYQWESLGKEFGVSNTDEFIKRAQSINQSNMPFGLFGGRSERPQR
jgi:myosin heavy subunit